MLVNCPLNSKSPLVWAQLPGWALSTVLNRVVLGRVVLNLAVSVMLPCYERLVLTPVDLQLLNRWTLDFSTVGAVVVRCAWVLARTWLIPDTFRHGEQQWYEKSVGGVRVVYTRTINKSPGQLYVPCIENLL